MFSVQSVGNASGAGKYFAADNYYTKDEGLGPSQWIGQGAKHLGLSHDGQVVELLMPSLGDDRAAARRSEVSTAYGSVVLLERESSGRPADHEPAAEKDLGPRPSATDRVKARDLIAVLEGHYKDLQLGGTTKNGRARLPGYDIGMSVSKSVSIVALVGEDNRVVDAFRETVLDVYGYIERNLTIIRDRRGGEYREIPTGDLTMAVFIHDKARGGAPQLHAHGVAANATRDPRTGEFTSLWARPIYKNSYSLDNLMNNLLENRLKALGYDTYRGDHGRIEISGVPDELIKHFSPRRGEITASVGPQSTRAERQIAALNTRPSKASDKHMETGKSWAEEAAGLGFDVKALVSEATTRQVHQRAMSRDRAVSSVYRAIRHFSEGSTTFNRTDLVSESVRFAKRRLRSSQIEAVIEEAERQGALVTHSTRAGRKVYTTNQAIARETRIVEAIRSSSELPALAASSQALEDRIARSTLDENQAPAARALLTAKGRYVALQAGAGAGKTYTIGEVFKILSSIQTGEGARQVFGMAPTHSAAATLSADLGAKAMTVDRALTMAKAMKPGQSFPKQLEVMRGQTVVLDETSMMSASQMDRFVALMDRLEISKVFLVGDRHQHESVQAGATLRLVQRDGVNTVELAGNRRSRKNPVLQETVLTAARNDKAAFADRVIEHHLVTAEDYVTAAANHYQDLRRAKEGVILMSPDNTTRRTLIDAVRQARHRDGEIDIERSRSVVQLRPTYSSQEKLRDVRTFAIGDFLHFHRAIPSRGIERGDVFRITNRRLKQNMVQLEGRNGSILWTLGGYRRDAPYSHYDEHRMDLTKGDEIVFKGRFDDFGISRDQKGVVRSVRGSSLKVVLSGGRYVKIPFSHPAARMIDSAYIDTTYVAQGKTMVHSITAANDRSRATTTQAIYIGVSRGELSAHVYAASGGGLKERMMRDTGDAIAIDAVDHLARLEAQHSVSDHAVSGKETGSDIEDRDGKDRGDAIETERAGQVQAKTERDGESSREDRTEPDQASQDPAEAGTDLGVEGRVDQVDKDKPEDRWTELANIPNSDLGGHDR